MTSLLRDDGELRMEAEDQRQEKLAAIYGRFDKDSGCPGCGEPMGDHSRSNEHPKLRELCDDRVVFVD